MAQRNPMNERYAGDGPVGKTRKSAAKLKPKAEAASSVHIEKKPVTKQERKAARKKREAQLATKERERQQKAAERERAAKLAAGEEVQPSPKPPLLAKIKKVVIGDPAKAPAKQSRPSVPDTPEYHRYKRIYWILMGVGVVGIVAMFIAQIYLQDSIGQGWMVFMGVAYAGVIGAIIIDNVKIRKLQKAHAKSNEAGRKSPKQLKHDEQKTLAAKQLEEARKAQRQMKRDNFRLPLPTLRKSAAQNAADDTASANDPQPGLNDDGEFKRPGSAD